MTFKKIEKLVIDRAKWIRGLGEGEMLDGKGNMCCLGFHAAACGVAREAMLNERLPDGVMANVLKDDPTSASYDERFVRAHNTIATQNLYEVNDDEHIDDAEREAMIIQMFAGAGITVTFEGQGNPYYALADLDE